MGLSRHVIPTSPVIPILTLSITYYIDHITSGSANFETALSLLSSFFVPEDDDALLVMRRGALHDGAADRATRAEAWLLRIHNEVEQTFFSKKEREPRQAPRQ